MELLKKLAFGILILLAGLFLFIKFVFMPTPDFLRNTKVDGIKMEAKVSIDWRLPIIRTYKLEEYEEKSEAEKQKVNDKVSGKIEGDITCVDLLTDKNIYFSFYKDENKIKVDETPKIEITAFPSHYNEEGGKKLIVDDLTEDGNGDYIYEINRYSTQYEKYFMEYSNIKVYYTIEGTDYISIFGTFSTNAPDGTDFFENEELLEPIPPETN